jgi:glucose/arabinose dehydrogenase
MKHNNLVSLTLLILIVVLAACAPDAPAPTPSAVSEEMTTASTPSAPPTATTKSAEALPTDVPPTAQASATPTAPPTRTSAATSEPATSTSTPTQTSTATAAAPAFDPATLSLGLVQIADGLNSPVFATHAGDGSGRLFVVEKKGQIQVLDADGRLKQPFLDIRKRVGNGGSEQGLLGLAFHPNFGLNGRLFVYYTDRKGNTVISRFQANAERTEADPDSEVVLLTAEQPASNHNGGMLAFGPDGKLYAGLGDGGGADNEFGNGQKLSALLGKILRIDVDSGVTYTVPADNPFTGQANARPETWAYGLRNPWRFSFDRQTGDLWIADVGQGDWEEVNFQPAGSRSGANFGWSIMEGTHCFDATTCDQTGLTLPVAEYAHGRDCSVSGGYVYRGAAQPRLQGVYFYGDYCSGIIRGLAKDADGQWQSAELLDTDLQISSFGETEDGEVLVVDYGGAVYRLVEGG